MVLKMVWSKNCFCPWFLVLVGFRGFYLTELVPNSYSTGTIGWLVWFLKLYSTFELPVVLPITTLISLINLFCVLHPFSTPNNQNNRYSIPKKGENITYYLIILGVECYFFKTRNNKYNFTILKKCQCNFFE